MGKRQPRIQSVAAAACALALSLSACGPGSAKGSSKAGPSPVEVDAGPDVEALQIQTIAAALNEFGPAVHTCWARAAADDFQVKGRLVLDLDIGEGGVAKVSITTDEVNDAILNECMTSLWSAYRWPSSFTPGDRIQLPPFEFVAPDAQYVVASEHVTTSSVPALNMRARTVLSAANTGNSDASLLHLTLASGSKAPLHSHDSAQLLFVLSGTGVMQGIGGGQKLGPGSAVYIPAKTVHGLHQQGEEQLELMQFYVPGGPEGRFANPAQTEGTTLFTGKLPKRGPKPLVRGVKETPALRILGGKGEVRIILDEATTGDKTAYLGALTAHPGSVVPLHRHSGSSEYLFVIQGDAEMRVAGKVIPVRPGDGIQIPSGVEHGVTISGSSTFKALQLYSPAGPEQRFKAGGK